MLLIIKKPGTVVQKQDIETVVKRFETRNKEDLDFGFIIKKGSSICYESGFNEAADFIRRFKIIFDEIVAVEGESDIEFTIICKQYNPLEIFSEDSFDFPIHYGRNQQNVTSFAETLKSCIVYDTSFFLKEPKSNNSTLALRFNNFLKIDANSIKCFAYIKRMRNKHLNINSFWNFGVADKGFKAVIYESKADTTIIGDFHKDHSGLFLSDVLMVYTPEYEMNYD